MNQSWERTYVGLCLEGFLLYDMPSANNVWGSYLKKHGFKRNVISNECPDCYTVNDFCKDHPEGTFILATSGHIVTVCNGSAFDSWDSSQEVPIYYWYKEEE